VLNRREDKVMAERWNIARFASRGALAGIVYGCASLLLQGPGEALGVQFVLGAIVLLGGLAALVALIRNALVLSPSGAAARDLLSRNLGILATSASFALLAAVIGGLH
jgi:hypothetical protein